MSRPQRRFSAKRAASVVVAAVALLVSAASCSDGRPEFCDDFAKVVELKALRSALDGGDLDAARAEAAKLTELASEAPDDVRADLEQVTDAVSDIVSLIADSRAAVTTVPGAATTADPAELESRREELNERLSDLSEPSAELGAWASRTCGIELS